VRHAIEAFSDVDFQEPGEASSELLCPQQGGDAALALAAGIGIGDQPALEVRLAHVHDGVVQHALGEAPPGVTLVNSVAGRVAATNAVEVRVGRRTRHGAGAQVTPTRCPVAPNPGLRQNATEVLSAITASPGATIVSSSGFMRAVAASAGVI
jgi:hypothetical protein